MFALSRVLLTTPPQLLRSNELLFDYINELSLWVAQIAQGSPSPTNQECAATCHKLIGSLW